MHSLSKKSGFTLVELMVTVAVFAIIATFAVPAFRTIIVSNSVAFDRDEFFNLLQLARGEAIKNGTATTICKSSDGASCNNALGWNGGWLLFKDEDRDGTLDAPGDTVIKAVAPLDGQVTVNQSNGDNVITFESRGLLLDGDGIFTFSHSEGTQYDKTVAVGLTGRATKG